MARSRPRKNRRGGRRALSPETWTPVSEVMVALVKAGYQIDDSGVAATHDEVENLLLTEGGKLWKIKVCPVTGVKCIRFLPVELVSSRLGINLGGVSRESVPMEHVLKGGDHLRKYLVSQEEDKQA